MSESPLYGLLLAGGESRRMGHDKALLDRGGESQLEYLARIMAECVDRVFVSTREQQKDEAERARFEQIIDRYEDMGPIAGILSAMESYPDVDWLVLACDLPNVEAATIKFLRQNSDAGKPFSAYSSSYDELPEPLCAIYRRGSVALVRDFVGQGIYCPRKILIRSDTDLLTQPEARALDNINTPDDLSNSRLSAV